MGIEVQAVMRLLVLLVISLSGCVGEEVDVGLGVVDGVMGIGPQGGFHLWLDARVSGDGPTATVSVRTVDTDDAVMVAELPAALASGYAAILCPPPPQMNVVDRQVRVVMTVVDDAGGAASDERVVTLRCPTDHPDVLTTCLRICDRRVE